MTSQGPSRVAVVTVVHGRHRHLWLQQRSLAEGAVPPDDHVVVAMDDRRAAWWPAPGRRPHVVHLPLADDRLPLAAARNLGARTAVERGADLLVFLDVDCVASPGLVLAYEEAARRPLAEHAVLCGPVSYLPPPPAGGYDLHTVHTLATPHPARPAPAAGDVVVDPDGHDLFWSLSFALTPSTWERVGGFDEAYAGYGAEDTDFGQRAAAAGAPLAWVGGARAAHQHHPTQTPPVQHLDDVLRNGRLFRDRWGRWPMQGWLDAFEDQGLVRRTPDGDYERCEPERSDDERSDAPPAAAAATM